MWDLDGRRHKKPKKSAGQKVITSNASLHKVDLPRIKNNPPDKLSPKGRSQPNNLGRLPNNQSFGVNSNNSKNKFVEPQDPRLKQLPNNPPTNLNTASDYLVDIDIKPNRGPPASELHEPPINDPPAESEPPVAPKIPGVPDDPTVDPEPYLHQIEQNERKLKKQNPKSKVVVEDDFIEPTDFRDPGGRKNKPPEPPANLRPKSKSRGRNSQRSASKKSRSNAGSKERDPSKESPGRSQPKSSALSSKPPKSPGRVSPEKPPQQDEPSQETINTPKSRGILKDPSSKEGSRAPPEQHSPPRHSQTLDDGQPSNREPTRNDPSHRSSPGNDYNNPVTYPDDRSAPSNLKNPYDGPMSEDPNAANRQSEVHGMRPDSRENMTMNRSPMSREKPGNNYDDGRVYIGSQDG